MGEAGLTTAKGAKQISPGVGQDDNVREPGSFTLGKLPLPGGGVKLAEVTPAELQQPTVRITVVSWFCVVVCLKHKCD